MRINKLPTVTGLRGLYENFFLKITPKDKPESGVIKRVIPGNAQTIGARAEQQDAFGFSEVGPGNAINQIGVLAVLADGMGGLQLGREAAQLAVETMLKGFDRRRVNPEFSGEPPSKTLWQLVEETNSAVYQRASEKGLVFKTGTTLVAVLLFRSALYWVSVGDSRIYLYRNQELSQVNVDHVYGRELDKKALANEITGESAEKNQEREALTSYVGIPELLEVDRNIRDFPLQSGDRVMLCSDGLYRALSLEEMKGKLQGNPAEAAEALIQMVMEKGKVGQDNATVAILACE